MIGKDVGRLRGNDDTEASPNRSPRTLTGAVGDSEFVRERIQSRGPRRRRSRRRRTAHLNASTITCAFLAATVQTSMAQGCISLKGSTACPAFNASSVSTSAAVVGLYPFLSTVTDTDSFDSGIKSYVSNGFAQLQYAFLTIFTLSCTNSELDMRNCWVALTLSPIILQTSTQDTQLQSFATISYSAR